MYTELQAGLIVNWTPQRVLINGSLEWQVAGLYLILINALSDMDESTVIKNEDGINLERIANILEDKNQFLKISLLVITMG